MNEGAIEDATGAGETLPFDPWEIRPGIQGYIWRAREPRADLLLQHGFGEYAQRYVRQYSELIPKLLDMGVNVYAFDMEGHGLSTGRRGTVDVNQAVQDHLAARRALRDELSARSSVQTHPLFVLGHSLGGLVAAGSVALDQSGLSGAIIMSAAFPEANALTRFAIRALAAVAPHAAAPSRAARVKGLSRIPEAVEAFRNDPLIYHGRIPNRTAATAVSRTHANRELYPDWTLPTLILHGTADQTTDAEGSRKVYEAIASNDKTLHMVEGGYHELLNDLDRDETLRVLLEWLEKCLPASS